ncbi:carbohydrate sulfotransferase 12-like [Macrobrachium nipponense]|uniref:carbohydrate sulfotransferase 12-like n=1 Tax=Macrobrachium nipponense TaxID=159736 RepID=UPI0030C7E22F
MWDIPYRDVQTVWKNAVNSLPEETPSADDAFEDGWTEWGNRQELRKRILTTTCNHLRVSQRDLLERLLLSPALHFRHLLLDDRSGVIYCYIPEIALDSWGSLWESLTGDSSRTSLSSVYESQDEAKARASLRLKLMTYTKVVVVQHPFLRLLSTYRARIYNQSDDSHHQKAIRAAIHDHLHHHRIPSANSSVSWPDFVSFLTKGNNNKMADDLWKPYEAICHPCAVEYDVIAKAETLHEDSERFLRRIGAPKDVRLPSGASGSSIGANRDLWDEYQEMLSEEQLDALRKAYERDLKLFAYK